MTESAFVTATVWSYGLALTGYLVFGVRVAIGSRENARARLLLAALVVTSIWALSCLSIMFVPGRSAVLVASIADALRYGIWFLFVWRLLSRADGTAKALTTLPRTALLAVGVALVASAALGEGLTLAQIAGSAGPRASYLLRLVLAVSGLLLVEQLVRRVQPSMRWGIKPLAVALGGVFGFDLFYYADAMLFGQLDPDIWVARGFANLLVIPFLAIATARNTGWTVDLHLSRDAVFHSSALAVSGTFLLAVAGAGYFVRYFGGEWGRALQIELLFAAILFVALVASSGRFRSRLKVFVSKHFFSYRFDYRAEWLRFTGTLSTHSTIQGIEERTVMALADLVESPAGALWLRHEPRGFVPIARWNTPSVEGVERSDAPLAAFLERTGWIVSVDEFRSAPAQYAGLALPDWLNRFASPWLIVPLPLGTELLGFVVLATPRTRIEVNWEVRDLLKTASRQAASYLGQIRAAEALLEARKFDAFNRMSAFVVHDLKNLVAQLSLMLRNARRHRDNPQFQADMLSTVENVVGRMNALMLQLGTGAESVESRRAVDLDGVVRRVCSAKQDPRVPIAIQSTAPVIALGHEDRLEHVFAHLLQNAIDACLPAGRVDVRVERDGRFAVVVVSDDGVGMSEEFVRERLFKPFQTTKESGMGIGVYESAQYISGLGGSIDIDSRSGAGTTVRIRLPHAEPSAPGVAPAITEHAA